MSRRERNSEEHLTMRTYSPAVLRRTALLMDGVARAALFAFGPRLVYRLAFHKDWHGANTQLDTETWSQIAYPVAIVTGAYTIGRALGGGMASYYSVDKTKLPRNVARLAGISFSLHAFAFGAGLGSVRALVAIRFLVALLAGYACGITNYELPEDKVRTVSIVPEENMEEGGLHRTESEDSTSSHNSLTRAACDYIAPGTAKIYMTGFAVSILLGGLLYNPLSNSITMQAYAGGYPYSLSPIFFVVVAALVEVAVRAVLWLASGCTSDSQNYELAQQHGRPGTVGRFVSRVVNRRVKIASQTPERRGSSDRLHLPGDLSEPLSASSWHRDGHSSQGGRSRLNSGRSDASISEFFDCNSAFSDEVIDLEGDPITGDYRSTTGPLEDVAVYMDSKTVYPDGSPAFVPQGECVADIPKNYIECCGGNRDKALKMWTITKKWRREKSVWNIHRIAHPFFKEIKQAYPHCIHGHSKQGYPIIYEQPGRMNLKQFFRNGGEISEMVRHYTFMMEFVSNCVVTRDDIRALGGNTADEFDPSLWRTMVVMDIKGATITSLNGDVIKYLKEAGVINSSHYPNRLKRAFLVNCPFWLAGAYSTVRGLLPESVQVEIYSTQYIDGLRNFIDDDQIPPEYGGSSPYPLGQHPYEVALEETVQNAAQFEGRDETDTALFPITESSSADELTADRPSNSFAAESIEDGSLAWNPEVGRSPLRAPNSQPLRRRASSHDHARASSYPMTIAEEDSEIGSETGHTGETGILIILSFLYLLWCAVQGALEVAVPLWVLSPPVLGGLGYVPSRSGIAMFSASLVLLWVMRTKVVRAVSQMPNREPMRAFRIGVGSETALLVLLPLVPTQVTSIARSESVLIMASTIILLSCMTIANMLGGTAAAILHRMAANSYSEKSNGGVSSWMAFLYSRDSLLADCESGKFTAKIRILGEVLGIVTIAPLYSWSTMHHRPFPFDGACSFFVSSLVAFVLYVSSFSLFINLSGEFAPHPRDGCGDAVNTRRCCSFVGEVIAVSAGDMASLFEEANWSSSPLLGYCAKGSRDRRRPSVMERGEAGNGYTTKKI